MRLTAFIAAGVLVSACTSALPDPPTTAEAVIEDSERDAPSVPAPPLWPPVPETPTGGLDPAVNEALDRLLSSSGGGSLESEALDVVAASGDARLAWLLSDMLRFAQGGAADQALAEAFTQLTGVDPRADDRFGAVTWLAVTNLLIGWDLPAPPAYRERKAELFLRVEPAWEPFFADEESAIDWRWVSWGGVFIDDRPSGDPSPCLRGCIPALDDPALTSAEAGDWYADDRTVFGVVVNEEAVAFPQHMMEVHEMVNLTIGGRRIGMPYCTLCASAQAYLTDAVPAAVETPVLRTSGLLSRSNKVMYDLVTDSVFNTFTGQAVSGPLHDAGIVLEQTAVVVTTWGDWKAIHPGTRIVARDGGIGRTYPDDPLGGRDDNGPIFPIGPVDPRLPAQAQVLGVIDPDDGPVAFPVEQAATVLASRGAVVLGSVEVVTDAGGLRARLRGGDGLASHQAAWFAWSQFHPRTSVWSSVSAGDPPRGGGGHAATPSAVAAADDAVRAYATTMCAALGELGELDAHLSVLRGGGGTDGRDGIAAALTALTRVRGLVASAGGWLPGAAFREAILESLDAIGSHLRAAGAPMSDADKADTSRLALRTLPFITTDRVEVELRHAMKSGLRC